MTRLAAATVLAALATMCAPAVHAQDPLDLMETVADWQLAHIEDRTAYPPNATPDTWEPRGWIQSVFFVGLTDLADRSRKPRFSQAIMNRGASQHWQPGDRLMHADDQLIAQVYLWAYARAGDPTMLAPTRANFDAILAHPPHVSLEFDAKTVRGAGAPCQVRWCWCDALFMAPRSWAELSATVGDMRYLAYADTEFWATTDYLYDRNEHLFYRDSRFFPQRDERGRKIFWSRGNGWVIAGIARLLEVLPPNYSSRPRYETLLREMAARLVTLQTPAGYWPTSLVTDDRSQAPETSGTAFIVYGLAWGVNHGVLERAAYQKSIERGWGALARAVDAHGKLGWVQQVGVAPDVVRAEDTQFYAAGALLLAGGQVRDLRRSNH
jgi:rhamnogalacturonyl hydrolase YesR